jgi:hypothetical protein
MHRVFHKSRVIVYHRDLEKLSCAEVYQTTVPRGKVDSIDLTLQAVAFSWARASDVKCGDGCMSTWRRFRVVKLQEEKSTDVFQIIPVSSTITPLSTTHDNTKRKIGTIPFSVQISSCFRVIDY